MNNENSAILVSVIVPIYNTEKFLKKCVDSIISQSYRNIEIILVDDGSTDSCGMICDNYLNIDSRVIVIHKNNGGLSSARNAGIDKCKGDYISFVDSDDFVSQEFVEKLLIACINNECDISICNIFYSYIDGRYIKHKLNCKSKKMNFTEAFLEMNVERNFDMAAWNKLYKRTIFGDIRFPLNKLSEDYYIMYLLFDKANSLYFCDESMYYYLQRENSITKNCNINKDFLLAAISQCEWVEVNHPLLKNAGIFGVCSAYLTVYDFYIKNKVKCPKEFVIEAKNHIRNNRKVIIKYSCFKKKVQFALFLISVNLYKNCFTFYRKCRRVQ